MCVFNFCPKKYNVCLDLNLINTIFVNDISNLLLAPYKYTL